MQKQEAPCGAAHQHAPAAAVPQAPLQAHREGPDRSGVGGCGAANATWLLAGGAEVASGEPERQVSGQASATELWVRLCKHGGG